MLTIIGILACLMLVAIGFFFMLTRHTKTVRPMTPAHPGNVPPAAMPLSPRPTDERD